jgi:formiminoglutamase
MSALRSAGVMPPATAPDDPRVGHLLGRALGAGARPLAAIVGFPSDEGVRRNGGRPGAADGPRAIREVLYRLTPDALAPASFAALVERTADLGDITVSGDLEADQRRLGETLTPLLRDGVFVLVLGGGHETAYGHFLGHAGAGHRLDVLNWDAHADVREPGAARGHSGTPFRQSLEHPSGACRRYVVAGLQPHSVAAAHLAYVRANGRAVTGRELTPTLVRELYAALEGPALVSFDLDALDQVYAPGVSAPCAAGLAPELWLLAAYLAGRTERVASCDIVELSPPLDEGGRTARLAALTAWQILQGLSDRRAAQGAAGRPALA